MHIGSDRSVQCPDFVRHITMLPSQMGQIWPFPGELDSCRGLRPLRDPNDAELAAKVQNCCPELAVFGANETGVFCLPHWLRELQSGASPVRPSRPSAASLLAYDP